MSIYATLPKRNGRIFMRGVYFPGEIPPPTMKLAKPPVHVIPEARLKESARGLKQTPKRKALAWKRSAIIESFSRLKKGRLVAAEQGCTLSYVYKVLELAGVPALQAKKAGK